MNYFENKIESFFSYVILDSDSLLIRDLLLTVMLDSTGGLHNTLIPVTDKGLQQHSHSRVPGRLSSVDDVIREATLKY